MTKNERGFTLVELMITVAIIAVLASVATVGYRYQARRARISQAEAFLAAIAASEAGRDPYIGSASVSYCPAGPMGPTAINWDTSCQTGVWLPLGVATPNQTYFQFTVIAGGASDNCTLGSPICDSWTSGDRWWIAVARGDLDGDSTLSTFITSYALQGAIVRINEYE